MPKAEFLYVALPEKPETIEIIKAVAKNSFVVGADITELAPIKNFHSYNFLAAKLCYKTISYI